ncbi:MAG: hypothetical protein ACRDV3_12580 [Acidothermaceae bacterium]
MSGVRLHAILRAGYGSLLLFCPAQMVEVLRAPPDDSTSILIARVLGARHLAQATVTTIAPLRKVVVAGAFVDALHGITDIAMATADPRWRRAASTDAAVAFTSAGAAILTRTTGR